MADFIGSGNPQKMIDSFSHAIDYATQPTNDDWKRVYDRSTSFSVATSNGVADTNAQNLAKDFIPQVKNSTTADKKFDLNAGYIECAVRITNVGSSAATLHTPTFALYFVGDNKSSQFQKSCTIVISGTTDLGIIRNILPRVESNKCSGIFVEVSVLFVNT
ncbi:MAG TPA: hypothetical protein VGJ33_18705 [Candidatus Angelobacter sp.]|jgi:hypothetical protein